MAAAAAGGRATSQPKKTAKGLTPRQKKILETIQRSVNDNGYPPSMREIGDTVGLASLSSVTHQLSQLEKLGYLRRDPKRPRAMEVLMPLTLDGGSPKQAAEPASIGKKVLRSMRGPRSLQRLFYSRSCGPWPGQNFPMTLICAR